tara:strand:+ start:275 stop:526 length:252 start_codon:yes stop_codon:yes gene_type:complete
MINKYNSKKGGLDSLHDFDDEPNLELYDDVKQTQLAAAAFEKDNKDEDLDSEHAAIRRMLLKGESPGQELDSKWDRFSIGGED